MAPMNKASGPAEPKEPVKLGKPSAVVAEESTTILVAKARSGDRSAALSLLERAVPTLRRWTRGRIPAYTRGQADTVGEFEAGQFDGVADPAGQIGQGQWRALGARQRGHGQLVGGFGVQTK